MRASPSRARNAARRAAMIVVSAAGLALASCAGGAAAAPAKSPDFAGYWLCTLDLGAQALRVGLSIAPDGSGGLSATLDSPDQGAWDIPADSAVAEGRKLSVKVAAVELALEVAMSADGRALSGTYAQRGVTLPVTFARLDAPLSRTRPQDPVPPFPYEVREISFPGGAEGVTLAGSLVIPAGKGPFRAVVMVTGSGPQDRDEALAGHRPFLVLADRLARAGIASLRYDDRGVAKSTGSFATATSADFALDALAAVRALRAAAGPLLSSVGVLGHSEGGLVGPMAANAGTGDSRVDFVVMLAGPAADGVQILLSQGRAIRQALGVSRADSDAAAELNAKLFAALRGVHDSAKAEAIVREELLAAGVPAEAIDQTVAELCSPWMLYFLDYDPLPALRALKVPALALYGAKDLQVLSDLNAPRAKEAFAAGDFRDKVIVLPGLNHLFQHAGTGAPSEYSAIAETMSEEAMRAVAEWIGGL